MREITIIDLADRHERADQGFDALAPYPLRALTALWRPASAHEIRDAARIPIASVYRSIRTLESIDFIRMASRSLVKNNVRVSLWVRAVRSLTIEFHDGQAILEVELRDLPFIED